VIKAMLFVAENGCKWRDVTARSGKWRTVEIRRQRWADAGGLDRLFAALQEHHVIRIRLPKLSW